MGSVDFYLRWRATGYWLVNYFGFLQGIIARVACRTYMPIEFKSTLRVFFFIGVIFVVDVLDYILRLFNI